MDTSQKTAKPVPSQQTIDWWADRVDEAVWQSDGSFKALCPTHDDVNPSLHVSPGKDGQALVHCFAGCRFGGIYAALAERDPIAPKPVKTKTLAVDFSKTVSPNLDGSVINENHKGAPAIQIPSAMDWWVQYTGVPEVQWRELGVDASTKVIVFGYASSKVSKRRPIRSKKFSWSPEGLPRPDLWPEVPKELPPEIFITEGESDVGPLRYCDLPTFAWTKGSGKLPSLEFLQALNRRGVSTITLVIDEDAPGREWGAAFAAEAQKVGISVNIVRLVEELDIIAGEKDVRDLWLRLQDKQAFIEILELSKVAVPTTHLRRWETMSDLPDEIPPIEWLLEGLVELGGVGALVGDGGLGKTWLLLLLAGVIASRFGQLDHKLLLKGAVLLIDEESGKRNLHRRIRKLLEAGLISSDAELFWQTLPRFNPYEPADIEWLGQMIVKTGAKVVVIDAWVDTLNGRDENSSSQVQPGIMALRDLAELCDTTIIVIHHTSHIGRFRGSTALKDGVDWMLQIEEQPKLDPGARRLFTIKNRHGPKVQVLCQMDFDPDGLTGFAWLGKVTMVQSDSKKREPTPQALWVMSQLRESGRTSKSDLRGALPPTITVPQLTNAIDALKRWNWINHLNAGQTGVEGVYDISSLTIKEWGQFTETDETDEVEEEEADGELE